MNMFKKNGGFTLVELIVVIAILAILAGVAIPAYSGYINSANEAADTTALSAIKTAVFAACATEGTVTEIAVATNKGVVTTITVTGGGYDSATDIAADSTNDQGKNFDLFYTTDMPTLKSDTFKDGAKWTSASSEWVKP